MKIYVVIFLSLITITTTSGQFSLLKDVNPGVGGNNGLFFKQLNPGTWIISWDGGPGLGQELWKTDGTTTGTTVIKDIYPGSGWGVGYSSDPEGAILNNELFIPGSANGIDYVLYKTNGTAAGTIVVSPSIIASALTNIDNTLYFGGSTAQYGAELYKTDGTSAGTVLIKDIWPGINGGLRTSYRRGSFVKANGFVFFRASDSVHGVELWRTDGTTAGTQMVKDIFDGPGDGLPVSYQYISTMDYMKEWNGSLYFVAQSGTSQEELWKTDGTTLGTTKVSQLNGTGFRPFVSQLIQMGDRLYFLYRLNSGNIKLFSSDGTTAGTMEVSTQSFSLTSEYLAQGSTLFYFTVLTPQTGFELWRSDGTAAGTFMIKDLNPGPAYGMYQLNYANCFVNWNDIYFTGDNGQTGLEIFLSDGSPGNATLVYDAVPGNTGSDPRVYSNVSNRLTAKLNTNAYGIENWISDDRILFPDLLSFTGAAESSSAKLKWKTINEENGSYFELEKSTDGNSYNRIATIQALGGNVMEGNYLYTDPALPQGLFYYRLKVFKLGGRYKYSNTVKVEITGPPAIPGDSLLKIYGNPASGTLNVKISKTESDKDELQITDMLGRILKRKKLSMSTSSQIVTLELNGVAAGGYHLTLIMKDKRVASTGFIVY